LFSRHMSAMENIVEDMEHIRLAEAPAPGSTRPDPNWEMAVAVLDVVRDDLKSFAPTPVSEKSAASAALPAGKMQGKEVKK